MYEQNKTFFLIQIGILNPHYSRAREKRHYYYYYLHLDGRTTRDIILPNIYGGEPKNTEICWSADSKRILFYSSVQFQRFQGASQNRRVWSFCEVK